MQFVTIRDAAVQFCSYFLFQRSHGQESLACHKVHLQNRKIDLGVPIIGAPMSNANVQCFLQLLADADEIQ